tara:strand:+ start:104 stop:814 length:711 start_codon:yes stop_codon:yes gene_type:complete
MTKKLFSIFFYSGVILVCIVFLPSLLMPKNITIFGGKILGHWSKICLKLFLSTKIEIIGKENILNSEKFFIACTHQSAFETFYLQAIFKGPKFILKKELIKIPIFGWYLKKIGSIPVERNKISKEKINFVDTIKISSKDNRPIVIFPQGTRTNPNERPDFKKGVARIYQELNINCLPVTINSGEVWPKNGNLSKNKKITITILKPIKPGLEGKLFLNSLQNTMYDVLNKTSSPSSA